MTGTLRIGTSGWAYKSFGPLRHLSAYAREFPTVEVNGSFHRLLRRSTCARWADETPDGFCFALKLSRYLSHVKRLGRVKVSTRRFLRPARPLGEKLGPVLVQLPETFRADPTRLARFLDGTHALAKELGLAPLRISFEPRHPSWLDSRDVLALLERAGAALVFAHSSRYPYPCGEPCTADFVYLRFHGPRALFASPYGVSGLQPFADKIRFWQAQGLDVYAYFNNDARGHALRDARALCALTGRVSNSSRDSRDAAR